MSTHLHALHLIIFSVRGYTTARSLVLPPESGSDQNVVKDLLSQKQALLLELKHYENNAKYNDDAMPQDHTFDNAGVIPANTRLQVAIATSEKSNDKVCKKIRYFENFEITLRCINNMVNVFYYVKTKICFLNLSIKRFNLQKKNL